MNLRKRVVTIASVCVLTAAVPARAQLIPATPDNTKARVEIGPLWVNPSVLLSDLGVDTNVFNAAESQDPQQDVALSLVPQADLWMRMGRTWLTGTVRQDLIWYREYVDQRAVNGSYRAAWLVPLTRISMLVDASWLRAKERTGFEIDTRTEREEWAGSSAAEVLIVSRTFVGGRVERRSIHFDDGQFYGGENLQEELDRARTSAAVNFRYALTPMTSLTAEVSSDRDRFELSPERDADSMHVTGEVTFDPAALIKGAAQVGYRRFMPKSPVVPEYEGMTFTGRLTYVARESTQVGFEGVRDVEYSFDRSTPYYLLTGISGTVTQRIHGPLDAQGRAGWRALAYRDRALLITPSGRTDHVRTLGGGMGYRLSRDVRMSFDIEHQERTSEVELQTYRGLRYGVSVSYGL